MEVLILAILLGLIPAAIARNKGRSFVGWWIFGALLLIVALPAALLVGRREEGLDRMQSAEGRTRCPHCAEWIRREARVCKHCGRDVEPQSARLPDRTFADRTPRPLPGGYRPGERRDLPIDDRMR